MKHADLAPIEPGAADDNSWSRGGIGCNLLSVVVASVLITGCGSSKSTAEGGDGPVGATGETGAELVSEDEPSQETVDLCQENMSQAPFDSELTADLLEICEDFGSADSSVFESAPERLCVRQAQALRDPAERDGAVASCAAAPNPFVP